MNLQQNSSGKYTVRQCILYFFNDSTEQTVFAISMERTTYNRLNCVPYAGFVISTDINLLTKGT